MPQMSPMWWTMIMIFTTITILLTMTINYFNMNKKKLKKDIKENYKIMILWKW